LFTWAAIDKFTWIGKPDSPVHDILTTISWIDDNLENKLYSLWIWQTAQVDKLKNTPKSHAVLRAIFRETWRNIDDLESWLWPVQAYVMSDEVPLPAASETSRLSQEIIRDIILVNKLREDMSPEQIKYFSQYRSALFVQDEFRKKMVDVYIQFIVDKWVVPPNYNRKENQQEFLDSSAFVKIKWLLNHDLDRGNKYLDVKDPRGWFVQHDTKLLTEVDNKKWVLKITKPNNIVSVEDSAHMDIQNSKITPQWKGKLTAKKWWAAVLLGEFDAKWEIEVPLAQVKWVESFLAHQEYKPQLSYTSEITSEDVTVNTLPFMTLDLDVDNARLNQLLASVLPEEPSNIEFVWVGKDDPLKTFPVVMKWKSVNWDTVSVEVKDNTWAVIHTISSNVWAQGDFTVSVPLLSPGTYTFETTASFEWNRSPVALLTKEVVEKPRIKATLTEPKGALIKGDILPVKWTWIEWTKVIVRILKPATWGAWWLLPTLSAEKTVMVGQNGERKWDFSWLSTDEYTIEVTANGQTDIDDSMDVRYETAPDTVEVADDFNFWRKDNQVGWAIVESDAIMITGITTAQEVACTQW